MPTNSDMFQFRVSGLSAMSAPNFKTTEVWPEGQTETMLQELLEVEQLVADIPEPSSEEGVWKEVATRLRLQLLSSGGRAPSANACRSYFEASEARWQGRPVMEKLKSLREARAKRLAAHVVIACDSDREEGGRGKRPRREGSSGNGGAGSRAAVGRSNVDSFLERFLQQMLQIEQRRAEIEQRRAEFEQQRAEIEQLRAEREQRQAEREEAWRAESRAENAARHESILSLIKVISGIPATAAAAMASLPPPPPPAPAPASAQWPDSLLPH